MDLYHLILFIVLALIAEIIGTVGGFGSSMLFVPMAGYFLDFHSVLGITALFHVASNLSKIALFRNGFNKHLLIYMGIPAVLFVSAGAWLSRYIDTYWLDILLGVFLITLSLIFLVIRTMKVAPTTANAVTGGIISGLVAGLLGTGGAIRGMVLSAYTLKTEIFIATSAMIDLAIDVSRSFVYTANGFVHYHDLYLVPILVIVSFTGTYIGRAILKKMNEGQFKNAVLILTMTTGIITLSKHLF